MMIFTSGLTSMNCEIITHTHLQKEMRWGAPTHLMLTTVFSTLPKPTITGNCHNTSLQDSTRILPTFLPFDEPNICNDYIFMNSEYNDRLSFLNQVDLDTDLLDNVTLYQVVIQPTKKTRSIGPHKLKSKTTTTTYKKKSYIKNKILRSANTQLHGGSNEPNTEQTYYNKIYSIQTKI